jgi:phage terminase large subunit GpA-like protein
MSKVLSTRESGVYRFSEKELEDMWDRVYSLLLDFPFVRITETVSEWMTRKMILSDGQSVYPGRFDFSITPFLREIADNLSVRSGVTETAVIKGNQLGFSTVSFGFVGYCIDHGIGPALFVSGDQKMAEDTMEKRIDAVIEAAGLQEKIRPVVKKRHDKSTGDRRDVKSYAGTFIRAVGPRSESKLRSFPSRVNLLEELDVFPQNLSGRGNPIEKVVRRSDTFGPLRRLYYNSTPKIKQTSQIEPLFEAGDKRLYHVPCPTCGHKQPLVWAGLKWDRREDGAPDVEIDPMTGQVIRDPVYYECAGCGAHWRNSDKFFFLRDAKCGGAAEWIPTKKPDRPGIRSYKLCSLYSPFRSWLDIALQFWRVKDDAMLFPDFVNDVLAETWEEKIATPQAHYLEARAEDWECGHIPDRVLFVTLAADIQADRIEAALVGWGKDKESWALNYWVFPGTTEETGSRCWRELEAVIDRDYTRADGVALGHPIVSFIDAGYLQAQVNAFCAQFVYSPRQVDGVYPVIGKENQAEIYKAHRNDIETPLLSLHDQRLKKELYSYLKREPPAKGAAYPYGYVHFPRTYGRSWYEQLTAEDYYVDRDSKGRERRVIDNRKQRRNEALDCVKMNLGALHFMCLRWYEIENKRRKAKGRKELEIDWGAFWQSWTAQGET